MILDDISDHSKMDSSNLGLAVLGNGFKFLMSTNKTSGREFQKKTAYVEVNNRKGLV